jgi:hypothetical protein
MGSRAGAGVGAGAGAGKVKPAYVALAALAIVVLVAYAGSGLHDRRMVEGFAWATREREAQENKAGKREGFSTAEDLPNTVAKPMQVRKVARYVPAFSTFFTSGTAASRDAVLAGYLMYMQPSAADLACDFMTVQRTADSCDVSVDRISCVDRTTNLFARYTGGVDRLQQMAVRARDTSDCTVYILGGMYQFLKTSLSVQMAAVGESGGGAGVKLILPRSNYATRAAMLLRPVYVRVGESVLYSVDWNASGTDGPDYNSEIGGPDAVAVLRLVPVDDVHIEGAAPAGGGSKRQTALALLSGRLQGQGQGGDPYALRLADLTPVYLQCYYLKFLQPDPMSQVQRFSTIDAMRDATSNSNRGFTYSGSPLYAGDTAWYGASKPGALINFAQVACFLQIHFPQPATVERYALVSVPGFARRFPSAWVLEGTNRTKGSASATGAWVAIDAQRGVALPDNGRNVVYSYAVPARLAGPFTDVRFRVLSNADNVVPVFCQFDVRGAAINTTASATASVATAYSRVAPSVSAAAVDAEGKPVLTLSRANATEASVAVTVPGAPTVLMPAYDGGVVVATCTYNCIVAASVAPGRTAVRRVPFADEARVLSYVPGVDASDLSKAAPQDPELSSRLRGYCQACVPNLADVAARTNCLVPGGDADNVGSRPISNTLQGDDFMAPGDKLRSANGAYLAVFQSDGDLAVYRTAGNGIKEWSSGTAKSQPTAGGRCVVGKRDGIVRLFDVGGQAAYWWSTEAAAPPDQAPYSLVLGDDGALRVVGKFTSTAGMALNWASNGSRTPHGIAFLSTCSDASALYASLHAAELSNAGGIAPWAHYKTVGHLNGWTWPGPAC